MKTLSDNDFNKQFYLFTGKGGVGKTAVSLAFARSLAARGKRTLWVEMTEIPRATDAFENYTGAFLNTNVEKNLWAARVTLQPALEEYLHIVFKIGFVAEKVARNGFFQTLTQALPGMDSLVMLGKLEWELGRENGRYWDAIVLDAPATGHAVTMLRFPKAAQEIVPVGPVYDSAVRQHKILSDAVNTGIFLVTLGEELPVTEVMELHQSIKDIGYPVAGVFVNGLYLANTNEADTTHLAPYVVDPAMLTDRQQFLSNWHEIQQRELERLAEYCSQYDLPITQIPFMGETLGNLSARIRDEVLLTKAVPA